jgi:death-on-curing protein
VKYLSQFDVLQIRTRLQAAARQPFDLLNPAGLHSALAAPRQFVFGEEMRAGVIPKAAILFLRLIQNHPFYDGNKRIAVEALHLFCRRNDVTLTAAPAEALLLARRVALGEAGEQDVETWIRTNSRGEAGSSGEGSTNGRWEK